MSQEWKQYEAEVAEFFRSLGLDAAVEHKVDGVRAAHEIDVWVTSQRYGIEIKWIVECKLWNSPVTKEKVLALHQIIQDVGADRGVLLSESGFQAGAVQAATATNITLSSLDELREHSKEEKAQFELSGISKRLALLDSRLRPLVYDDEGSPFPYHPTIPRKDVISTMGSLFEIRIVLPRVYAREFPVHLGRRKGQHTRIPDIDEFVRTVDATLNRLQIEVEDHLHQANACQEEATVLGNSLADAVDRLLEVAEAALFDTSVGSEEFETRRMRALEAMEEVGRLSGDLKPLADSELLNETRQLMRLLIDGVYLHLAQPSIERDVWDQTRDGVIGKLHAFRDFLDNTRDRAQG